jgi:hypothetical protein
MPARSCFRERDRRSERSPPSRGVPPFLEPDRQEGARPPRRARRRRQLCHPQNTSAPSAGFQRQPRFTFHFTPTYSSWLNLVERWFAELTSKWLQWSTHHSVKELVASIRTWITNWNDDPKPFVWHKTADEILDNLASYCQRISDSGH